MDVHNLERNFLSRSEMSILGNPQSAVSSRSIRADAHCMADHVALPETNIALPENLHVTERIVLYLSGFSEVGKASTKSRVKVWNSTGGEEIGWSAL